MLGHRFSKYVPSPETEKSDFERLLKIFMQLLLITAGNVSEALQWLTEVDKQYKLTNDQYGIGDFIEDLKRQGYITESGPKGEFKLNAKSEQTLRQSALEEIFGKLKKTRGGEHKTYHNGRGDEPTTDRRDYEFGDAVEQISMTDSIKNAQINHGFEEFLMTEEDLEVIESEFKTQTSTVLMIDISHSMIPYLQVGPYHTNTVAGLELAMDILRRRKNANKQIFMITDGKPTCIKQGIKYYKNSFGLDSKILTQTLNRGVQLRKLKIPVTTFMIATDPYLKAFVRDFTKANNGNAYYSSLAGLGNLVFEDFKRNRRKNL